MSEILPTENPLNFFVKNIPTISIPPLEPPDLKAIPIPAPPNIPPMILAESASATIGLAGIGTTLRNKV